MLTQTSFTFDHRFKGGHQTQITIVFVLQPACNVLSQVLKLYYVVINLYKLRCQEQACDLMLDNEEGVHQGLAKFAQTEILAHFKIVSVQNLDSSVNSLPFLLKTNANLVDSVEYSLSSQYKKVNQNQLSCKRAHCARTKLAVYYDDSQKLLTLRYKFWLDGSLTLRLGIQNTFYCDFWIQ